MAKPKNAPKPVDIFEEMRKRREKISQLPLVDERWLVEEKYPDWHEHSVYDSGEWHRGKTELHGPFSSEEDAQKFVDQHEPTESGGTFRIRHEFLRTHTKIWNEWGTV